MNFSYLVREMGWAKLTTHALRWQLPADCPDRAEFRCTLIRTLLCGCARLAPALLSELLVPGFAASSTGSPEAASKTVSGGASSKCAEPGRGRAGQPGQAGNAEGIPQPQCPWGLAQALLAPLGGCYHEVTDEAEQKAVLTAVAQYATWLLWLDARGDSVFAARPSAAAAAGPVDVATRLRNGDAAAVLNKALASMGDLLDAKKWGVTALGPPGGRGAAPLRALLRALEAAVSGDVQAMVAGRGDSSDAAVYQFRARCHLKAQLLMSGLSADDDTLPDSAEDADGENKDEPDESSWTPGTGGMFGDAEGTDALWTALRREISFAPRPLYETTLY